MNMNWIKKIEWKSYMAGFVLGIVVSFVGLHYTEAAQPAFVPGGLQRGGVQSEAFLKNMADQLGMTEDELKKEMDNGKSIRQIAQEKGIDIQTKPKVPSST